MRNKVYWGLGILIVLLIGAFVLIMVNEYAENRQLEADAKRSQEQADRIEQLKNLKDNPPPAEPGYKWVWHHNHWDKIPNKIPIAEAENTTPVVPLPKTTSGSLTYHAELLETNPVNALRLQQEERGHWSAKYIPPFPTDDVEAQDYARTEYLVNYYVIIGDTDNPAYKKISQENILMFRVFMSYPYSPRTMDLMRLSWPSLEFDSDIVFVPHVSNYFTYTGELKPEYAELLK